MNHPLPHAVKEPVAWRLAGIGVAMLAAFAGVAHGEIEAIVEQKEAAAETKPADDTPANQAAKRDVDALRWLLTRGLRVGGVIDVRVAQPVVINGPQVPDPNVQPQLKQQIEQQAQQLERMLEPVLGSELEMIRQACPDLASAARKTILASGRTALKKAATGMAERQLTGRFGQDDFDPRQEIRGVIGAELKKVGPEPLAAYNREQDARAARRAGAARLRIVASLDGQLDLSAAQRKAIEEDLERQWDASWVRALGDFGLINDQPIAPDFAAAAIEPHLAPAQKTAWKAWCEAAGIAHVGRRFMGWNFDGQGLQGTDGWWNQ